MKNAYKLIISIIICELAGIIGSIFTSSSIPNWYSELNKPELAPPNWLFGPVWIILFALMGISLFLIWKKGINTKEKKDAVWIFTFQLILNMIWSIIFFGLFSPKFAFLEIIILWLAILWTIISFAKISKASAWLLMPYILWVSFAGYLNFMIWILNV